MAESIVVRGQEKCKLQIRYGKLTQIGPWFRTGHGQSCVMRCNCGVITACRRCNLRNAASVSCGCHRRSSHITNKSKHGLLRSAPAEYRAWSHMVSRCTNPNCQRYKNYGGRGIKVCERWLDNAKNFYFDMGPRPSLMHSLDRIDNDGDYNPENCRWATDCEQGNNTSKNRLLTIGGVTMNVTQWSRQPNVYVKQNTIYCRLALGWSDERSVFEEVQVKNAK